jgi:hypothetical protein
MFPSDSEVEESICYLKVAIQGIWNNCWLQDYSAAALRTGQPN